MGQVLKLRQTRNEVVTAARELLFRAESGYLSGFIYIASTPANEHDYGMAGTYADNPASAVLALTRMMFELSRPAAKLDPDDPSLFGELE